MIQLNDLIINFNESDETVWIGTEDGAGAKYTNIKSVSDLNNAITTYANTYGVIVNEPKEKDEYHTMDDLYNHRTVLFAALIACNYEISWKSLRHADGSMDEGYFIAGIDLPDGQVTYHQKLEFWDLFKCRELEHAPEWDGYTSDDVLQRLIITIGGE